MTTTEEAIAKLTGGGSGKKKTTDEAVAALTTAQPAKPESNEGWGQWFKNIDQALAQGVVKGVVSLPGLPGDVQQLLQAPKRETDLGNLMKLLPQAPTSTDVLGGFEDLTGEKFKTYEGVPAYAERAGEFFTPTPGGKLKLGREAAAALAGGVGSKSFEDIAGAVSPEAAPWASLLGGLLGVAGGAKFKGADPVKPAVKAAPTPEALRLEKDAAYAVAEGNRGLDRKAFAETASDIVREAENAGIEHVDEPGMFPKIRRLLDKDELTFNNLDSLARRAGNVAANPKYPPITKEFGRIILDNIDKYYDKLEATDNPGIKEQVARAKDLGRSNLLSQGVKEARGPGYLSESGEELGEMAKARSYLRVKDRSLTPLEKKAAKQAVGKTARHSLARDVGQGLTGTTAKTLQVLATLGSMTPYAQGHGAETIATALGSLGLGHGASYWADLKTGEKLDELEAVLRLGKKDQEKFLAEAAKINKANTKTGLTTGLLGSIRSQQAEEFERRRRKGG